MSLSFYVAVTSALIPRAAARGGIQLNNAQDSKGDLLRGFYLCQSRGHGHIHVQVQEKNHGQRKAGVQLIKFTALVHLHIFIEGKKKKSACNDTGCERNGFPFFRS